MSSPTNRGASVRLLPPLVFLVPLLVGILLGRLVPGRLPSQGSWPVVLTAVGALLVLAGLALMTWAVVVMMRQHTTVIPWAKVDHLMTEGPFRLARNPIYVGDALAYLGVTLIAGTWWPLVLLPLPVFVMQRFVIGREEAYLLERFGEPYAAYCARVRRWGVV
ncbi:MAG TPA: isoprenylcysteine carboxylmethyltransferase family protein [Dermatophilaceae bacterium]|nr:isoprenylcysteine carboxylmethyltransferase family protein [Dermatophilaceae bacterium]